MDTRLLNIVDLDSFLPKRPSSRNVFLELNPYESFAKEHVGHFGVLCCYIPMYSKCWYPNAYWNGLLAGLEMSWMVLLSRILCELSPDSCENQCTNSAIMYILLRDFLREKQYFRGPAKNIFARCWFLTKKAISYKILTGNLCIAIYVPSQGVGPNWASYHWNQRDIKTLSNFA